MGEMKIFKRNWRFDLIHHAVSEAPAGITADGRVAVPPRRTGGRLSRAKARALRSAIGKLRQAPGALATSEEEVFHDFAEMLGLVPEEGTVVRVLVALAERLVGDFLIEWQSESIGEPRRDPEDAARFPVRLGSGPIGELVVRPRPGGRPDLPPLARRRLRTLCALAAGAHRPEVGAAGGPGQLRSAGALALESATGEGLDMPVGSMVPAPGVQDATFLNAVLPYALAQARRHAEHLSILCIEVDRAAGIAELLGSERAEHAIRSTGSQVAGLIRASDFVASLDDGRLLAVLPRAAVDDALRIAQAVRASVEREPGNLPEAGGVTVSIGVAEFPACADNVFALFDAADDALNEARRGGRNRSCAAPALSPSDRFQLACRDLREQQQGARLTSR